MNHYKCSKVARNWMLAALTPALALSATAQRPAPGASAAHSGMASPAINHPAVGRTGAARSAIGAPRSRPIIRPNTQSANTTPRWEVPNKTTPHWETPAVKAGEPIHRGDRGYRHRVGYGLGYGVGFIGIPYYTDTSAFLDADADSSDQTAQAAQPSGPARPDYDPACGEAGCPPDGDDLAPRNYAPEEPRQPVNSAAAQSDGLDHPGLTLIFNNGRPPQKVSSYVLTSSAVFVSDSGHQMQIPVGDLDLAATVARNPGVDFTLPGGTK